MQVELDNRLDNQNKDALFGVLLEANNFEVPQESIDNEAQSLKQEMQTRHLILVIEEPLPPSSQLQTPHLYLPVEVRGILVGKLNLNLLTFQQQYPKVKMILGKGSMIAGFEDGLLDIAAGKSVSLDLTFPQEYHAPQLAGKDVQRLRH
jgi:FKBP-type peptidyl-prolyl cis-trans isomerase (trigger factor)